MVFLMLSSKLLKHSVIVAIDYWLALWTSCKTNQSAGTDALNTTTTVNTANATLELPAPVDV